MSWLLLLIVEVRQFRQHDPRTLQFPRDSAQHHPARRKHLAATKKLRLTFRREAFTKLYKVIIHIYMYIYIYVYIYVCIKKHVYIIILYYKKQNSSILHLYIILVLYIYIYIKI